MFSDILSADPISLSPAPAPRNPFIRKLEAYLALSDAEISALDHMLELTTRSFPAGHCLVEQGRAPRDIMVMLDGWAVRSKQADKGRQAVAFHLPGDMCDFHALLMRRSDCAIEAASEVRVAFINRRVMGDIMHSYPRIGQAFWCDSLSAGSIQREWAVSLATRGAKERICHLLCELQARLMLVGAGDEAGYALPLKQTDLGNACGLTPETASRMLARLRQDQVAEVRGREVHVEDAAALQRLCGFDASYLHFNQMPEPFRALFEGDSSPIQAAYVEAM